MTATEKADPGVLTMIGNLDRRLANLEKQVAQLGKDVTNCMSQCSEHHDKSEALHRHMDRIADDVRKQLAKEVAATVGHALSTLRLEAADLCKSLKEAVK